MIFEYDENNLDKFENFKGGEKYTGVLQLI